jgi:hypothetical protein
MRWTTVAIFAFLIALPLAVPAQPSAASDVDDGPWLPSAEQKALRKLWPKSVPFPAQLRFYKIAPAGQHLVILNGLDYRGVHAADYDFPSVNPNRIFPWQHSGGMHAVDANIWRNATAVALPPGGKIEYWLELTDAGAVRHLPRLTWAFPDGTLFTDLLLHTTADGERCFELRTREKVKGAWEATRAYTSTTVPDGYTGPGKSCTSCHDHAGSAQGYGTAVRGADQTFSWAPWRPDSISDGHGRLPVVLDERWPLKGYSGVYAASGQAAPEAAGQGEFAPAPSFDAPPRFRRR